MVAIKARFLDELGQEYRAYPISDQQFDAHSPPELFDRFLTRTPTVKTEDLLPTHLRTFDGQTLIDLPTLTAASSGASFGTFARKLWARQTSRAVVWKELVGEEFVHSLLQAGFSCTIVIRDPRDMITSQYFGCGQEYVGAPRPLLFLARQWRKSVAYGLAHSEHTRFHLVRFEDLWPELGVDIDQNSSFRDGPGQPGRYASLLPDCDQAFLEAACYAELRTLGYPTKFAPEEIEAILANGQVTEQPMRKNLSNYWLTDDRRAEECTRFAQLLERSSFDPTGFLFPEVQTILGRAMQSPGASARAAPD